MWTCYDERETRHFRIIEKAKELMREKSKGIPTDLWQVYNRHPKHETHAGAREWSARWQHGPWYSLTDSRWGELLPLNQWRGGTMPLCRKRLGIFIRREMQQFVACSAQMKAQQSACLLDKRCWIRKNFRQRWTKWMSGWMKRSEERGWIMLIKVCWIWDWLRNRNTRKWR